MKKKYNEKGSGGRVRRERSDDEKWKRVDGGGGFKKRVENFFNNSGLLTAKKGIKMKEQRYWAHKVW